MTSRLDPALGAPDGLAHAVAYECAQCKALFAGRGSAPACFCQHCGASLTHPDHEAPSDPAVRAPGKCVLLVEDSRVLRAALSKLITGLGHHVIEANDGEEALVLAAGRRPDLVITDLNMPRMGGMELIENLRRQHDLRDIPVIVLTGQASATSIAKGLDQHVVDYIVKDVSRMKEIRERLMRHL